MDGITTAGCSEPGIVEDLSKSRNEDKVQKEGDTAKERNGIICCCFKRQPDIDSKYQSSSMENRKTQNDDCGCARETRSFLSSPVYYIFIIVVTFCIFVVLFVELLIDTELFLSKNGYSGEEAKKVSTALHWFAFAVLAGFFVEIILRSLAWRTALFKECVSALDACVVVIAFITNLCATLVTGPGSPYDSISLIIILRLIRIQSLIAVKIRMKTRELHSRITKTDGDLVTANFTISSLHRRIEEKDYEIRQLQTHLGNEEPSNHKFLRSLRKNVNNPPSGAVADADLEMAIALSKKTYQEGSHGIDNKAFLYSCEEEEDMAVLVHKTPAGIDRLEYDMEDNHKVKSYMDDYFSKSSSADCGVSDKVKGGAIPKKRALNLPIRANGNTNNNSEILKSNESSLQVLQVDTRVTEPILICVDPSILNCESPVSNNEESLNWEKNQSFQVVSHELSSQASEVGSSDDSNHEVNSDANDTVTNCLKMASKTWPKKSGSSISSESGYLSEDPFMKKRREELAAINKTNGTEIETSAL